MYLKRFPLCADPFKIHSGPEPATDVDHILAKRSGGRDTFENFQALCHSCHSRKTNAENKV
jgi:5-methylcytosine-specific restriction endonuclease McrA